MDSVILFDGHAPLPPGPHGLLEVVCSARSSRTNDAALEGVLRQLKTSSGAAIGKRFGFPTEPQDVQVLTGRWVKFTPPATIDAHELLRLA
ncbi:hypothetical protein [Bradyrhizobium sp. USDA 3458]|uniref:hypothetical protein n=1 Tax=Bradyrhizobium sp. USDA 3458 TaxID=2591461 RepID=UPI001143D5AB|nr:hypothetical protein [Bradyrhizobium sp. USDA 3458]